jgi:hypothetical protein
MPVAEAWDRLIMNGCAQNPARWAEETAGLTQRLVISLEAAGENA